MNPERTIRIILPAYNEEGAIHELLQTLAKVAGQTGLRFLIIVVDDGSRDRTADIVQRAASTLPIRLLQHSTNRGLPEALRTGFREALRDAREEDLFLTMDADNTHPPDLIPTMVKKIDDGNDVVIASRYTRASQVRGVSSFRRLMSDGTSWLFRLILPIKGVKDFTCGYRLYHCALLKKAFESYGDAFINQPGFSCMADILIKLRRFDPVVAEVPLTLRYDLKKGASKMKVWKTVLETFGLILKRRLGIYHS